MNNNVKYGFKLVAKNQDDLKIISAYIQDSIVTIEDIVFLEKNRILIMILNRFMWEYFDKGVNKRIRCAIKFEGVLKVRSKKINQKNKKRSLECLAIECNKIIKNNYEITFLFSGGGAITLISEIIEVIMQDIGEPWKVKYVPKHNI